MKARLVFHPLLAIFSAMASGNPSIDWLRLLASQGIALRELARRFNIPAGTVLVRSKTRRLADPRH